MTRQGRYFKTRKIPVQMGERRGKRTKRRSFNGDTRNA